jgi:hypothetical protein
MSPSSEELLAQHVSRELETHGFVRPPWQYMDEHPCCIGWRMGGGEWHLMMFWSWWESLEQGEASRIAWVRRWSPGPLWYPWCARLIWPDLEGGEEEEERSDEEAVARLAALGIGSVREWQEAEERTLAGWDNGASSS